MRGPTGTGRDGVSMAGHRQGQGERKGWEAVACHHRFVLEFSCISAFCLDQGGCYLISVLCTHTHEFLYILHLFHFIYFLVKNTFNIQFLTHSTLSLADTYGSYCYCHTVKEWPNTHTHAYKHTHTKQNKTNRKNREEKKENNGNKQKEEKEKRQKELKKKEGKKKEGVKGLSRGSWVLRMVGLHTNNVRSTWMFSVFHHLQKDKQRKQRHSLCEAR